MNNQDLINSIFSELRKCFVENQIKYKRLACEEMQDNHQDTAHTFMTVSQTYERALSKVIEIEVNTRIIAAREEEENEKRH